MGEDRFPEGQEVYLLFNSDIANYYYLFEISEGETERPNFVIFVVWSALIVSGCVLCFFLCVQVFLAWSRNEKVHFRI